MNPMRCPQLAVVVPCFNESENIGSTVHELSVLLQHLISIDKINAASFICLVDDGSTDDTWCEIEKQACDRVRGIKLSANFGHQNALLAGLFSMKEQADCFVTIDADLQDDHRVIEQMIDRYVQGNKIVYGVRESRLSDTFFKRASAELFYKSMNNLGVKTIYNHADFRLCDRQVLMHLEQFNEVNLFLRGIFPLMGFKFDIVTYQRKKRLKGETKYPLRKMISFAWQGITSFNTSLLRFVTLLGVFMFILSLITTIWALITYLNGKSIQGWTSLLIIVSAFSGMNMICMGIIGEYVAKIFFEVKHRPRYIIDQVTSSTKNQDF